MTSPEVTTTEMSIALSEAILRVQSTSPEYERDASAADLPSADVVSRSRSQEEKADEIAALAVIAAQASRTVAADAQAEHRAVPSFGEPADFQLPDPAPPVKKRKTKETAAKQVPAKQVPAKQVPAKDKPKKKPRAKKPRFELSDSNDDDSNDDDDDDDDCASLFGEDTEEESDSDEQFEVEKILRHKGVGKRRSFEIQWVGFDETTWASRADICPNVVADYENSLPPPKPAASAAPAKPAASAARSNPPSDVPKHGIVQLEGASDAPVELRHTSTASVEAKAFNGVLVGHGEQVDILISDVAEDIDFYYVRIGRKKGWIQAKYVAAV